MSAGTGLFTKCGSYNPSNGDVLVFDDNKKFRKRDVSHEELEYLGVVTSIKDSVVTDYSLAQSDVKKKDIDRNIVTFSKTNATECVKIDSLLIRPSDAIERINRQTTNDLRHSYTKFLNNVIDAKDFEKSLAMSQCVASSIGIKFGLDTGVQHVVYNKTASQGFNIFNSHPLAVEAHTDADIIIMMGIFLKHNSLWRSSLDLNYRQFDYAKSFFKRDESTDTPFFAHDLASVIPFSNKGAFAPLRGGKRKRRFDDNDAVPDETTLNIAAARNLIRPNQTNSGCRHDYTTQYVRLSSNGDQHCVACFCSLFFMGNGNVSFKDKEGLQAWIDNANSGFFEERLAKHLDRLSRAECHREIDHDYKFWNLISSLDARRRRVLPQMDTLLVFANANNFGKMLLILMHNNLVVTKKGVMDGRWFSVSYIGPNMWKFQITSCKEQTYEKMEEMACIETLRRLPMGDEPILSRVVFKVYCRGETLSSANEMLADVAQTVKNMRMCLEDRRFYFDEGGQLCSSAEVSDEVLVSLEVTGYKPNRAQNNINSNRVSARVMRLLDSREGARVWKMSSDTVLFENLSPKNPNSSYGAMEKMTALNRVYYYDIETTGNKCTVENTIITSICGSMCVGGEVDEGERTIFALAVGDASPADLMEAIRKEYPEKGDMSIDYAPNRIYAFKTEYELLLAFSRYMREAKPHTLCGWNSVNFDDPFVFYRMAYHIFHQRDVKNRMALAIDNGLFNFEPFFKNGTLLESFFADVRAAAEEQDNRTFMEQKKMGGGGISAILGGCCKMLRLDMKEVCRKAFENLSEYNLNAVLKKVSKVGDKMALLKDPIGVEELLGYAQLKTAKQQAPIHKYCSKDAYLVGVVDKSTNKGGEMRRLCYDSTLIESVVMANMPTPLCISDGAICRSMGKDRAVHRGNGIRKHSMGTDTKGGMVSKPMVNCVPLQTVDMSSLYPSCMCHNNLCTSTFVTHRQVINLRDREVTRLLNGGTTSTLLEAVDKANAIVMGQYRPIDIVVKSWRIDATDTPPRTMLEKKLGIFWDQSKRANKGREWCKNKPPCYSIEAAGMEYFPEYNCNIELQRAANVNDDMHINPSDLEYMVSALPVMALEDEGLVSHVTCGTHSTVQELLDLLEEDFDEKSDADIIKRLYSHVGTDTNPDWSVNLASERCAPSTKHQRRVVGLLDRIMRRVNAFDSSSDVNLRKWSNRMINVGGFVRTWNAKKKILGGVIPGLQADYKASRSEMQHKVKAYADIDPKVVEFNKIGEKTTKLSMNAIYGCLALRANPTRKVVGCGKAVIKEGGVGGGTRHSPTANQITSVSRCVFGNIACAIQQALPNAKQVYGDTDSVFCNHNVPGEGGKEDLFVREGDGRLVYRIDTVMKNKIAEFLPLLINAMTKGIKFDAEKEAGVPFMKIAHERLAFISLLFAKKTYHMIHLKEGSPGSNAILACDDGSDSIKNIASKIPCPDEYRGYVVAHNPSLILSAAALDDNLSKFLAKEGVTDEETLKKWFTSSEKWLELDAEALYNMYVSTMVDVEEGGWIDWRTARPIEKGTLEHDRVTQVNNTFILYKKGMFVKKGLVTSSKLKGLQSLINRNLPRDLFDRSNEYRSGLGHHVKNCASFEANPMMFITSSRVNKYNAEGKQKLPNPMAMMLNNHLLPTKPIQTAEKFLTVPVVSSWAIYGKGDVPSGYFDAKSVKWDHETMRGLVPGTVVKNLSVIPNTIKTILEMVKTDAKNVETIIEETVSALITASSGTSGVAFRKGALCYSTGLLCSDTMVRRVISDKQRGGERDIKDQDEDSEDEEEEPIFAQDEDKEEDDSVSVTAAAVVASSSSSSTPNRHIKYTTDGIKDRIFRCMLHDTVIFNNPSCPVSSSSPDLKELITKKLKMDKRVCGQLEDLIDQLCIIKNLVVKKRKEKTSELDEMIAAVDIDFDTVADICAERMIQHCKKCPVILPEGEHLSAFEKILNVFAGKEKCTATCANATCQALDFVLLCTLALREIEEEKGEVETQIMREASNGEYVKKSFGRHFNNNLDAVVLLTEEASSHLDRRGMDKLIRKHAHSLKTGQVYNPDDGRFFGGLLDRDAMVEKILSEGGEAVALPFVTGLYYREVVELAVSKLCKNKDLVALLG